MPPRARTARREPPGRRPHGDGAPLRGLRGGQAAPRASSTSRTSCCSPSASSTSATTSPAPCAGQYRQFVVDEYQDVNALQQRLLDLWLGERNDLCVVGDPAQTIYSFTGASAAPPPRLPAALPRGAGRPARAQLPLLAADRRAGQHVIVASGTHGRPRRRRAAARAGRRRARRPCSTSHADDPAEAAAVAARDRAARRRRAPPPREIAVLFRTNAQSEAFESALADVGRGLPRARRRALLRAQGGARRDPAAARRGPQRRRRQAARRASPATSSPAPGGQPRAAVGRRGHPGALGVAARALATLADDLAASRPGGAGCPSSSPSSTGAPPSSTRRRSQGVTLASLHAAKGLEWDVVFLVGASDGLIPISMAEGPEAVEEERRLLYVGLTRARRQLFLSWSGARTPGGRATRRVSRFLAPAAGILGQGARPSRRRAAGGRRGGPKVARIAHCRGCGAELVTAAQRKTGRCDTCPPTYDEATFERLRTWRLAVAREAQRPGIRRLHRRDAHRDRRGGARPTRGRCRRSAVSGCASSSSTAPTCSPSCRAPTRRSCSKSASAARQSGDA